jgi:hypothetical protein
VVLCVWHYHSLGGLKGDEWSVTFPETAEEVDDVRMEYVSGRIPPLEIDIDGDTDLDAAVDGGAGRIENTVEVDRPFAGQLEMAGAQLIAVTTLVTNAVEIATGAEDGGTTGCEV